MMIFKEYLHCIISIILFSYEIRFMIDAQYLFFYPYSAYKKTEKSKGKVASTIKMLRQIVTTKIGKPPKHDDATQ